MLKVFYLSSIKRNFISLIEDFISIKALTLWQSMHISRAVNFEQANTHQDITNIVKQFYHRENHYMMQISFGTQLISSQILSQLKKITMIQKVSCGLQKSISNLNCISSHDMNSTWDWYSTNRINILFIYIIQFIVSTLI